jgi:hypothetical protein
MPRTPEDRALADLDISRCPRHADCLGRVMNLVQIPLAFAAAGAVSCGGVSNSISGDPALDFAPTFIGSATFEGTCLCPDISGGPANYQGVVVLMSDECTT